jgi:hypothetical protein
MRQREQKQEQGLQEEKAYLNFVNSLRLLTYHLAVDNYMRFINIRSGNFSNLLKQDNKTKEQQIIWYLVDLRKIKSYLTLCRLQG